MKQEIDRECHPDTPLMNADDVVSVMLLEYLYQKD